jgi:hypothetical protein
MRCHVRSHGQSNGRSISDDSVSAGALNSVSSKSAAPSLVPLLPDAKSTGVISDSAAGIRSDTGTNARSLVHERVSSVELVIASRHSLACSQDTPEG